MILKQTCITEVRTAVQHAKPSATQLAELCFKEIEAQNPTINAYLAVNPSVRCGQPRPSINWLHRVVRFPRWPAFPSESRTCWS
jgi:hypothetical protein